MANDMVNENFTSENNQKSTISWPTGSLVVAFILALNIFLSITASLGNALILVALHKESSLYPPTKLFFRCLAVTDLCVGLIAQPLFAVSLMSFVAITMDWIFSDIGLAASTSAFTLCEVSIFMSTAISVDRLLALLLGLRYRHVVTLRRVRAVIIFSWLISTVSCTSLFYWNSSIAFTAALALTLLSLVTSVLSYTKIFLKLRHHRLQVNFSQGQPNGVVPLNITRYKKSVSSVIWVQIAFVACYIPFIVVVTITTYGQMSQKTFENAFRFTATLAFLNSSLNPILYCWRIGTVRQAAKDTIKQLNCCK